MLSNPHLRQLEMLLRQVAATQIMPYFQRAILQIKDDGSFCTEADLAAQQALASGLPEIVACPVLGEEMTSGAQLQLWTDYPEGLWVVDPVDGTTNFSRGMPFFAISVALMREGRPVLAAIYAPVLDEFFAAAAGEGAWLNGQRLPLAPRAAVLERSLAAIETKRLPAPLALRLATERPFHSQRNLGAATLDWCWLASGRFDLLLHGGQKLWDYAAGVLIAQEAGACIAGLDADDFFAAAVWERSAIAARTPSLFTAWKSWLDA